MAAHDYRTWLFQHEGLTVWNAQWYGGHHVLGYSLLFAPLAVLLGPALLGTLAAVAASAVFAPLARAAAPSRGAAAAAAWLFVAGVLSNLAIGRVPFLLGIALAVSAWACARRSQQRGWAVAAAGLSLCSVWASPVAGAFLVLAAAAASIGRPLRCSPCPRWPVGSRSGCCSRRAAPTASWRARSGRCSCSRAPA
jgi:hypothetical protein